MNTENNEKVSNTGDVVSVESSSSTNTVNQENKKVLKELENSQVSIKDQKKYINDLRNQFKEQKALSRSNYNEIKNDMPKKFVIKNLKTNRILEVQAVSSCHAAQLVGWRMRHTIVLAEQELTKTDNRTNEEVKLQGV